MSEGVRHERRGEERFEDDERPGTAHFAEVFLANEGDTLVAIAASLEAHPALASVDGAAAETLRSRHMDLARSFRGALRSGWDAYGAELRDLGEICASTGVGLEGCYAVTGALQQHLSPHLVRVYADRHELLAAALQAMHRFVERCHVGVGRAFRAASRASVRESEVRFARLYESGIIGILICDLVGNIKEANDRFLTMVGYSREEVISGRVRWSEMTPPEWRHLDDEAVDQLKRLGSTRTWEKEYFRKDGSRLPILVGVAMLNESECIAFILDITERRHLEELRAKSLDLETQNRRIQEASRLKSEFLANMSHELRTPLNSIIGFAELLYDGEVAADSPQHHEFIGDILTSGRHLLQLINDVLDLAKVEAGKIDFRPELVETSHLVTEVSAILRGVSSAKSIRIEVDLDPDVQEVTLDPARLKQVLYNYLSNAIKFTEPGGRVFVRVRPEGDAAFRIEVEDTGIGISPEDLGRLFVEFQQLNAGTAKRHGGTGLGLALTKRIVEAQGGTVGVKSVPGEGSVFFATLPRAARDERPPAEEPLIPAPPPDGASVLVVEDDLRDLTLIVRTLSSAGYAVEAAMTGAQAVARCGDRKFDAITLDLLLPDMTGLDVLHRVRLEGQNRDTPVLVVSVVAEKGVVGGFAVHDYLCKPVNGREIVASLERAGVRAAPAGGILVVDDDPAALKLMEAALTSLGFRAVGRPDGESALAALEAARPEAVVLDLLMPGVDGFEFLMRIRTDPRYRDLPVVVWTMKDLTNDDQRRLRSSAQAVLMKGGSGGSLVDALREHLSRVPRRASAALLPGEAGAGSAS